MAQTILYQFEKHPAEAAIIGRLVAGFGNLEFGLTLLVGAVLGDDDQAIRVIFRIRSETSRIDLADAIIRPAFTKAGLVDGYNEMLGAMRHCTKIRNQYAHCHWHPTSPELMFAELDTPAKTKITNLDVYFVHIDVQLLAQQEAYFCYAEEWLSYLLDRYESHRGKSPTRSRSAPKTIPQPLLHNSPPKHTGPTTK